MGLNVLPVSPATGSVYGEPTVFNATGTFTIPSTASANSTIIVEAIGGGCGGQGPSNVYGITNMQDYVGFPSMEQTSAGTMVIGTYRLGFLSTSPAGQTISVVVGAGGTGATMNGNATVNSPGAGSSQAVTNFVNRNAGGASSVSFGGSTFHTAAGGATDGGGQRTSTSFMTQIDSGILNSLGPRASAPSYYNGNISTNTMTIGTLVSGGNSRIEYGGTNFSSGTSSTDYIYSSGAASTNAGADAVAGTGAAGGSGGFRGFSGNATNTTLGRGGNGASPGGAGGSTFGYYAAQQNTNAHVINSGQKGGNGGAGRVRIYYQA
jgi:hypothetical protein